MKRIVILLVGGIAVLVLCIAGYDRFGRKSIQGVWLRGEKQNNNKPEVIRLSLVNSQLLLRYQTPNSMDTTEVTLSADGEEHPWRSTYGVYGFQSGMQSYIARISGDKVVVTEHFKIGLISMGGTTTTTLEMVNGGKNLEFKTDHEMLMFERAPLTRSWFMNGP